MNAAAAHISPSLGRNFNFHVLWMATFLGGIGDRLAMFLVQRMAGFGAAGGEGSEASIAAGTDLFFFLPYVLWGPAAGWLCDRTSRKGVSVVSSVARALIVLAALKLMPMGASALPADDRWMAWTLIAAIGLAAVTYTPCKMAMVPNLVGYGSLQRANAIVVNIGIIGNLFGALFGAVLARQPVSTGIAAGAACYGLSAFLLLFLRLAPHRATVSNSTEHNGIPGFLAGMRYLPAHRPALSMVLLAMLVWGATSVYLPSLAALAEDTYGGGQETFGYLQMALGIGMLGAGGLLGWANARSGVETQIALGLIGSALALTLQILTPWASLGIMLAVVGGFSAGAVLVAQQTLIQRITPDFLRGRVFGAMEMLAESSKVLASAFIFWMPQSNHIIKWLTLAVGLMFLASGLFAFKKYIFRGPEPSRILMFLWRLVRIFLEAIHRLKVSGKHHIPRRGGLIFVSNHTAGVDPMLIQMHCPRVIRWVMAREYAVGALGWFWRRYKPIMVERKGRDSRQLRQIIEQLKAGEAVGLFPEGGIRRAFQGVGDLGPGIGMIALHAQAPIVPVHISGTPDTEHPFASIVRPSHSRVVYGRPFTVPAEMDRRQASDFIRTKMNELAARANASS